MVRKDTYIVPPRNTKTAAIKREGIREITEKIIVVMTRIFRRRSELKIDMAPNNSAIKKKAIPTLKIRSLEVLP